MMELRRSICGQVTCVQQRADKLSSLFDAAVLAGPSTVLLLKPYIEQESTAIKAEYAALEDKVKMSEEKIEQRSHDYVVAAIAWKSKKCYRKVRIVNALLGKNDPLIIMLGPAGEEVPEWFARTHADIEQLEGVLSLLSYDPCTPLIVDRLIYKGKCSIITSNSMD